MPASDYKVGFNLRTLVTVLYEINWGKIENPSTDNLWANGQSPLFASANTGPSSVEPTPSYVMLVTAELFESQAIDGIAPQFVIDVKIPT